MIDNCVKKLFSTRAKWRSRDNLIKCGFSSVFSGIITLTYWWCYSVDVFDNVVKVIVGEEGSTPSQLSISYVINGFCLLLYQIYNHDNTSPKNYLIWDNISVHWLLLQTINVTFFISPGKLHIFKLYFNHNQLTTSPANERQRLCLMWKTCWSKCVLWLQKWHWNSNNLISA